MTVFVYTGDLPMEEKVGQVAAGQLVELIRQAAGDEPVEQLDHPRQYKGWHGKVFLFWTDDLPEELRRTLSFYPEAAILLNHSIFRRGEAFRASAGFPWADTFARQSGLRKLPVKTVLPMPTYRLADVEEVVIAPPTSAAAMFHLTPIEEWLVAAHVYARRHFPGASIRLSVHPLARNDPWVAGYDVVPTQELLKSPLKSVVITLQSMVAVDFLKVGKLALVDARHHPLAALPTLARYGGYKLIGTREETKAVLLQAGGSEVSATIKGFRQLLAA